MVHTDWDINVDFTEGGTVCVIQAKLINGDTAKVSGIDIQLTVHWRRLLRWRKSQLRKVTIWTSGEVIGARRVAPGTAEFLVPAGLVNLIANQEHWTFETTRPTRKPDGTRIND